MSNTFGKNDLARTIAEHCGVSISKAEEILTVTTATIREQTAAGKAVELRGFGKFSERVTAARMGRNPRTNEAIEIAESRILKFKASKAKAAA